MKTNPKMTCYHCEKCGKELLTMLGYVPTCDCGKEMILGGAPKAAGVLNPIKASKRAKKGK